jgi:hypothetical protein
MITDYEFARLILLRPRVCYGEAQSLRDVLGVIHGVALGRHPPHGSGFLPGFNRFLINRFKGRPHVADYHILLKQFGELPFYEGCEAVLHLLEEWEALGRPDD